MYVISHVEKDMPHFDSSGGTLPWSVRLNLAFKVGREEKPLWRQLDPKIQAMKELLSPQTDIKVISSPSQDQRKRKMHSEHKQKCPNIREFPISRWRTSSLGCIEYHVIVILCIMHHVYAIEPTGTWMLDTDIRCSRYFMRRTFKEGATHTWAVPSRWTRDPTLKPHWVPI